MKRGKKYQDAVKNFDKAAQYDVAEAISLVKKNATAKFVVMDVMQNSRSVVRLYYHTEQEKLLKY